MHNIVFFKDIYEAQKEGVELQTDHKSLIVAFIEDNASMSSIRYYENHVS